MATKQKKRSKKSPPEKPKKAATDLRPEKEVKINLKKLARDERTWKITGAIFILISLFLFISFISYFFTWSDDESQIRNQGISILFDKRVMGRSSRKSPFATRGKLHAQPPDPAAGVDVTLSFDGISDTVSARCER